MSFKQITKDVKKKSFKLATFSLGCGVTLVGEGNAFSTLDSKKTSLITLHGISQPSSSSGCHIDYNGTQHQSCNGTWTPTGNITSRVFNYRSFGPYLQVCAALILL